MTITRVFVRSFNVFRTTMNVEIWTGRGIVLLTFASASFEDNPAVKMEFFSEEPTKPRKGLLGHKST